MAERDRKRHHDGKRAAPKDDDSAECRCPNETTTDSDRRVDAHEPVRYRVHLPRRSKITSPVRTWLSRESQDHIKHERNERRQAEPYSLRSHGSASLAGESVAHSCGHFSQTSVW